jgi:hypothetical protein
MTTIAKYYIVVINFKVSIVLAKDSRVNEMDILLLYSKDFAMGFYIKLNQVINAILFLTHSEKKIMGKNYIYLEVSLKKKLKCLLVDTFLL